MRREDNRGGRYLQPAELEVKSGKKRRKKAIVPCAVVT
jgi:hypothetical protein